MSNEEFFTRHFTARPVMAIFRGYAPQATVALCEAAWDAGVGLVEVPVQSHDALPSLEAALHAAGDRDKMVGAGTVTQADQLATVIALGAAFTVAPGTQPEILELSAHADVPHLPGVATSSDISIARAHGLTWVKAFPAAQLGPDWISAQCAPFPDTKFVATGGVDQHNGPEFLRAGCAAIALGSALSDPEVLHALDTALPQGGPE